MKKNPFILIIFCIIGAILILGFLLNLTSLPNQKLNGFSRHWLLKTLTPSNVSTLNSAIERISGSTKDHAYFSGADPRWVIVTNKNLIPTDTLLFSIEPTEKLLSLNTSVDSPFVYLYANNISYLINGRTDSNLLDTLRLQIPIFMRFTRVSQKILIVRGFDSTMQHQLFKKIDCNSGKVIKEALIIENQTDRGFASDGFLNYDSLTNKIIYIQMYQNRFFCLDTNLNVIYTSHTIDTSYTNNTSIKVTHFGGDRKLLPSSPRQMVNFKSTTSNGYIYIASNLKSDNENIKEFIKNVPIDIYKIKDGTYLGSFYIPKLENKSVAAIHIYQQNLIVLYKGGLIATFQLTNF